LSLRIEDRVCEVLKHRKMIKIIYFLAVIGDCLSYDTDILSRMYGTNLVAVFS